MIIITEAELDIQSFTNSVLGDENGAVNTFLGVTRNTTAGKAVIKLEYECYLPMAQKQLEEIAQIKSPDLNAVEIEAAMKIIAGTARSMGLEIEGQNDE